ncbi:response regulator [Pseudorhodobacter sp. E13]|uniref:PP2C family protein-serine/threonine phosphatase n=1 Tax=Pseudorhodobacter sp. E13 TaxID=2487931 RepID=UPI000F8EB116|nr:SpoIIE family protein phosphatase [Pseudorhodobacter sp. E13]RUS59795.1 response regulator [Pseudorhodobacter sp. E13]
MNDLAIDTLPRRTAARHVLVVDDSRAQRRILALALQRGGYRVTEADSGVSALALCRDIAFDFVLSDWMMPEMNGLDFCQAFRALPREGYGYFILLTSKSEKAEIADGLDCGADDFLSKPVNPGELHARLRAGERILSMQAELVEKNRLVGSTLDELQKLYDSLDRDLIEARKLQQTLVRERFRDFGRGEVSALLRPSGHVGGDLVGFFEIHQNRIGIYSVDVSGHGVASAMMTARLSGLLSGTTPDHNVALTVSARGERNAHPPEVVAARLNRMMFEDIKVEQYFTLAYADIDLETGRVHLVQAGHPHPAIIRASGAVEYIGDGGMPIGLIPDATYERVEAVLSPGDRMFLVSDGVTECPSPDGIELGEEGLTRILLANKSMSNAALIEALIWDLSSYFGGEDFPDDVSGALFLLKGPP